MTTTGIEIAPAGVEDVGALVRLSSDLFREDAGTRDPFTELGWPAEHGRGHFLSLIVREDAICLLARSGRTPVGYLAGYIEDPTAIRPVKIAELQSMYVQEDFRNQGVGSRLVGEFLSWAGSQATERISVTAYTSNEDAMRFYARHGFLPKSTTLEMPL